MGCAAINSCEFVPDVRVQFFTFLSHQALWEPKELQPKFPNPFIIKDFCGAPKGAILELFSAILCQA